MKKLMIPKKYTTTEQKLAYIDGRQDELKESEKMLKQFSYGIAKYQMGSKDKTKFDQQIKKQRKKYI